MRFSPILKKARAYLPSLNEKRLLQAYELAKKAHAGQTRKDGQSYLSHPVAVADLLTSLYADEDTLIAALLHDVVEDTAYTEKHIKKIFGQNVLNLVDGVTVLNKAQYPFDKKTRKLESLKKFLRLSKKDLRVILIKLSDRLHNMRTLEALSMKRRIKLSNETQDIYIPIANLLGVWTFKKELEDLSFEVLKPIQFKKIKHLRDTFIEEKNEIRQKTIHFVDEALIKNGFNAQIIPQGRSLNSYNKKYNKNENIRTCSFNIIVPKKKDCYTVLGILHGLFKPRFSKIKDYIATPKANNYQSLHTVVFGIKGLPTSFQIRTPFMHRIDEYGILSNIHKVYAKNPKKAALLIKEQTQWLQKVLEISDELPTDQNFLDNLKMDVLNNRIFVFTPKGDIIDLPEGATALDFAYTLHTDIGNRSRKAEIDGISEPLSRQVQTGDTVKILTTEKPAPKLEWLDIVKTNEARKGIQSYFKKKGSENSYKAGKKLLEEAMQHFQLKSIIDIPKEKMKATLGKFNANNIHELLIMVGKGEILSRQILKEMFSKEEIIANKTKLSKKKTPRTNHPVNVLIEYRDRMGLFKDIASTVLRFNVNIIKISVKTPETKSKKGVMELILGINGVNQLIDVFTALEQIDNITYVRKK